MKKIRWFMFLMLLLVLGGLAALFFLTDRWKDCKQLSEMKWPMRCINEFEPKARNGDVRAMESLWLAYPNQGESNLAMYWLMEGARLGSPMLLGAAAEFCPRPPYVTRTTVLDAFERVKKESTLTEADLNRISRRMSQQCTAR